MAAAYGSPLGVVDALSLPAIVGRLLAIGLEPHAPGVARVAFLSCLD
jgi:hypothetical protein